MASPWEKRQVWVVPAPKHGESSWIRHKVMGSHEGLSLQRGEGGTTGAWGSGRCWCNSAAPLHCTVKQLGPGDAQKAAAPMLPRGGNLLSGHPHGICSSAGVADPVWGSQQAGTGCQGSCTGLLVPVSALGEELRLGLLGGKVAPPAGMPAGLLCPCMGLQAPQHGWRLQRRVVH